MKKCMSLLLIWATWLMKKGHAAVSCAEGTYDSIETYASLTPDRFCREIVGPSSFCNSNSVCSNIYDSGCLRNKLGVDRYPDKRTCNSDDPPDAEAQGLCLKSPFNYTEVRIHNSNWESPIFFAWAMQIVLSERLSVPVTVGLGPDTASSSFYDSQNRFSYSSIAYDYEAIKEANKNAADCTKTDKPCFHVMPEVWNGQRQEVEEATRNGSIMPMEGDGQVGKISWYIPMHTARRFPEMVSFLGLGGEENRQKMAETFKRPTTWKAYCDEVSADKCQTPDDFASRYPEEAEYGSYFSGFGSYIGHFRYTEKNNCTKYPTNCTGHLIVPPCTWTSYVDSQIYWNKIAVEGGGINPPNNAYTYGEMIGIYQAANATRSDVLMWWWTPDATVELFRGSEFEFQQVLLPEATALCRDKRINTADRCSLDEAVRIGEEQGSCDGESHSLGKMVASSLQKNFFATADAFRSPAYPFIRNFEISDLDMDDMLREWILRGRDTYGFDAREAVCNWVADNIDSLDYFLPLGYPRIFSDESSYDTPLLMSAKVVGGIACLVVLGLAGGVYAHRQTRVFVFAQVNFVLMLMFGLVMVAVSAILFAVTPSDQVCVAQQWFLNVGYTTEVVPLLVKLSAINKVLQSAKKMKRVQINWRIMYMWVLLLLSVIITFLAVWTAVDPPKPVVERVLEEEDGQVVISSIRCASENEWWQLVAVGWIAILLLMATILAFQTRKITQEFNESRSLGTAIYSHFLFMVLRVIVWILENNGTFAPSLSAGATSFLLSSDVMLAVSLYIAPKIAAARKNPRDYKRGSSSDPSTSNINMDSSKAKLNAQIYKAKLKSLEQNRGASKSIDHPSNSIVNELSIYSIEEGENEEPSCEINGSSSNNSGGGKSGGSKGSLRKVYGGSLDSGRRPNDSLDSGGRQNGSLEDELAPFRRQNRSLERSLEDELAPIPHETAQQPMHLPGQGSREKMRAIEDELEVFKEGGEYLGSEQPAAPAVNGEEKHDSFSGVAEGVEAFA